MSPLPENHDEALPSEGVEPQTSEIEASCWDLFEDLEEIVQK